MDGKRSVRAVAACVVLGLVGCAGCAGGGPRLEGVVVASPSARGPLDGPAAEVQAAVARVWPRTAALWPGVDLSGHHVLLTDGEHGWLVDAVGMSRVGSAELERAGVDVPAPGGAERTTWRGEAAVVVRPPAGAAAQDDPVAAGLELFALATRAAFAPPGEDVSEAAAGERVRAYPLQAEPRVVRTMVHDSLLAAYRRPGERAERLAAAAYWNEQWRRRFPAEAKGSAEADLRAGAAAYFARYAVAMATADDPAEHLMATLRPLAGEAAGDPAGEAGAIGTVALLNADALGLGVKEGLLRKGVPPVDAVLAELADVEPVRQSAPEAVREDVERSTAERNERLGRAIGPFTRAMEDERRPLLMLPAGSGRVVGEGLFTTEGLPVDAVVPGGRGRFVLESGTLALDGVTVARMPGPDGGAYVAVPLDADGEGVSLAGEQLTLAGGGLRGAVDVRVAEEGGRRVLYAR
ncbi:hypothetical protein IF129_15265 [Streptomyces chumphonensis]|uniref:Lipoprotein n=1 Tax=Streptomyces chumphonensis TaxID=1214925 RepID=A0A927EZM8_9ACTN|nr:hypothetical protein [Streptomyces chumphonensis]MBD3932904.1 hypothetical protein [Streptomyces chumphonensis]